MTSLASRLERRGADGVLFSVGLMALVCQTLLFRNFLTVFEGNELGIAVFFGSWLFWVGVGAALARTRLLARAGVVDQFELLPLLYIPAYVIQSGLILRARGILGLQAYELFPLVKMVWLLTPANSMVSLCTGALFTLGSQWMERRSHTPVARVYILESLGSFVGGAGVTILLSRGVSPEAAFVTAALLATGTVAFHRAARRGWLTAAALTAIVVVVPWTGIGGRWDQARARHAWERRLPAVDFRGRFATAQAAYLYGEARGQFNVLAWESVAETIPGGEHASEVIALHLAQHPGARRFLVAGPGSFSICRRLQDLPQADTITWLDPDPAYPRRLLAVLPPSYRGNADRLDIPGVDIRRYLQETPRRFDAIILNLPEAGTLALNRYFTREFFLLARSRLADGGIIGVRVSAGENFMGDELVNAGASVFHTLKTVFGNVAIKPGDETWLIASDDARLSTSPALLRDRYAAVPGAAGLYPPEGLMSLYLPDRSEYQATSYRAAAASVPMALLINTDRHPKSLLHCLLYAVREAGVRPAVTRAVRQYAARGALVLPLGLALYALLRLVYVLRGGAIAVSGARPGAPVFDTQAMVLATGAAGMMVSIVLMFMYQSVLGSMFLHVGLISALFMLGLAAGGMLGGALVRRVPGAAARILAAALAGHVGLVAFVACLPMELGPWCFAALFAAAGFSGGLYVPAAAARLAAAGFPAGASGSRIELLDHAGGAIGSVGAGLIVLPIFGSAYALGLTGALLALNLPMMLLAKTRDRLSARPAAAGRGLAYAVFGCAVFLLGSALLLQRGGRESAAESFAVQARAMTGQAKLDSVRASLSGGRETEYVIVRGASGETNAYIFSTEAFSPGVIGYAGPITLAVMVGPDGALRDFRVTRSRETPSYLEGLARWMKDLAGRHLFEEGALDEVHAVTGATLSSAAMLRSLAHSGPAFAGEVLGRSVARGAPRKPPARDWRLLCLPLLAAAALLLRRRPSRRARRGLLVVTLVVAGFVLNAQYALPHVLSLLGLSLPAAGWGAAFLLTVGIPLFVLLLGNVYCGYLCPFGAAQELVGDLRPPAFDTTPSKTTWQLARAVKYGLLALVVVLYAVTLTQGLVSDDLLATAFAGTRRGFVLLLAMIVLLLSFAYPRFWCRNLCPAGAFLALLNGVRLLRPWVPAVRPPLCPYGVRHERELDCLCCDRCRVPPAARVEADRPERASRAALFLLATSLCAAAVAGRMATAWKSEVARTQAWNASVGAMRQADVRRIRVLVERGELSDREARFYAPVTNQAARP